MAEKVDDRIGSAFFNKPWVQVVLISLMIGGVVICIYPPKGLLFKWASDRAFQIMLFYLGLGFLFLFLDRGRLLFFSFLCCGVLNLFLKTRTEEVLGLPSISSGEQVVKVALLNTEFWGDQIDEVDRSLSMAAPDMISVQEVTPFWDSILLQHLPAHYPYHHSWARDGSFGMSLYSKYPILVMDNFAFRQAPNLVGKLEIPGLSVPISFIGMRTYPILHKRDYATLEKHIDLVVKNAADWPRPLLVLGDLNAVPWSDEIKGFKSALQLKDSRKGFMTTYPDGSLTIMEIPQDYILYSKEMKCVDFQTLSTPNIRKIGIMAAFQLAGQKE